MVARASHGLEMSKKVFFITVILLIAIFGIVFYQVCNLREDASVIECDSSYSLITQEEAENIALLETERKYKIFFDDYGQVDSTYYNDGCWHILWYSNPVTCGGGVIILVDEETKHVISVEGQE